MISRRNIRVKVMQILYALETAETQLTSQEAARRLIDQHLDQSEAIYTYLLYFLTEVAHYARTDAQIRASKLLPTPEDLNVNTKIAENKWVKYLQEHPVFQQKMKKALLENIIDMDLVKKIYHQLIDLDVYRFYIIAAERDEKEEKEILSYIFHELMMKNEEFDQHMEDNFPHWPDDRDMMSVLINNFFQKPAGIDFNAIVPEEKRAYAAELLFTAYEKKSYCQELITPKLQHWDPDRIAVIDMILMIMAICEFLYFPTIPTKVTINEYIDIAKAYSTPQSGQFVNGILDNVLKDLEAQEKIQKTDQARN
ncbi:MAG: transcription antitermination factor NusB [Thermoflavifilum aggregans]|nr:transcription antitermination factor NusB [Thermoflavifilum aggregans]